MARAATTTATDVGVAIAELDAFCAHRIVNARLFRDLLSRIGDKWSLLVVGILTAGPHRFTELLGAVPGISQRMLTLTLRNLERDGLVLRTVFAEVPPRVEYRLTELGQSLEEPVSAIARWAATNEGAVSEARDEYDAAHPALD